MGTGGEPASFERPPIAFPFAAVVGAGEAKEALLALAVDPGLKGVILSGGPGMAKSVLVRAFRALIAGIGHQPPPFVEVPLGVTEDRLLGGLCLERTLSTGRRQVASGLLAQAQGGYLCVDGIHLLERRLAVHIVLALQTGLVQIEREGLSLSAASDFALIGTSEASEDSVADSLLDCVGLHIRMHNSLTLEQRAEMLRRVAAFEQDPAAFQESYLAATTHLVERVTEARQLRPEVSFPAQDHGRLSRAALSLGVLGHRGDIFAARFASARAALHGRTRVDESDLAAAVRLVLLPRARDSRSDTTAKPPNESGETRNQGGPREEHTTSQQDELPPAQNIREWLVPARDSEAPPDVLHCPQEQTGFDGGRCRGHWNAARAQPQRGRYSGVNAVPPRYAKIALDATLRVAAPKQPHRKSSATEKPLSLAIQVTAEDLRYKRFRRNTGMLIIFAVDASGSMALNRAAAAKGAILRLLREARMHRDTVALIGFRGGEAELLLAPSRSVERARHALDALPLGGGTPLAAGVRTALELARRARMQGRGPSLLVLLTDGRANVPMQRPAPTAEETAPAACDQVAVWQELERLGAAAQAEELASVVIDTSHAHTSSGHAERLARLLGGRYVHLPRPDSRAVCATVMGTALAVRRGPAAA